MAVCNTFGSLQWISYNITTALSPKRTFQAEILNLFQFICVSLPREFCAMLASLGAFNNILGIVQCTGQNENRVVGSG